MNIIDRKWRGLLKISFFHAFMMACIIVFLTFYRQQIQSHNLFITTHIVDKVFHFDDTFCASGEKKDTDYKSAPEEEDKAAKADKDNREGKIRNLTKLS